MVNDLAWPLVSESVKYRYPKDQAVVVGLQKIPLHATAVCLTTNIVQQANDELGRKVLKKDFKKDKDIMLFFSCRLHIDHPEDPIVAT